MMRREFITLLGGAAAAWPLAARAQQPAKTTRLGVLLYSTPQAELQTERVLIGLRELGYIEGRNLVVSYHYAESRPERLPDLAAALVRESPICCWHLAATWLRTRLKRRRQYQLCSSAARTRFNSGLLQALPGLPVMPRG